MSSDLEMGWDDNAGLVTERRVQNFYGVRCDPLLPYQQENHPASDRWAGQRQSWPSRCPRLNFVELCEILVAEDEKAFEAVWRRLGLSVDWTQYYTTIVVPRPASGAAGFDSWLALRPTRRKPRRSGTSTSGRRWRRPNWRTGSGQERTTGWCSILRTAGRRRAQRRWGRAGRVPAS